MSQHVCALVGAGPGLGLAIAQKFGREGYQIALLARRPEALKDYTNTLSSWVLQPVVSALMPPILSQSRLRLLKFAK